MKNTNKSSKKRILFITQSLARGGMETVLVNIANCLAEKDFDVTILCYEPKNELVSDLSPDVRYVYKPRKEFPVLRKTPYIKRFYKYNKAVWEHRASAKTLYKYYVGNDKYDVEIGFYRGPSIKIISGSTNKKSKKLAWVHTDLRLCNPKTILGWFNNIEEVKTAYGKTDGIICVSEQAKQSFVETIGHAEKTKTVYNLIPSKKIIKKSNVASPLTRRKFTIITVGRLIPDKRQDRLLSAAKRLRDEGYDFDMWIVGGGVSETKLKNYCSENSLDNVVFTGMQSNPYSYMKAADLFVLTSWREGFALVIPEAMACGLPILSTVCTGPTEILNNGEFGMLVDNSSEGVYNGIKNVLDNPELMKGFKEKSERRFLDFDEENIISEIIALFEF